MRHPPCKMGPDTSQPHWCPSNFHNHVSVALNAYRPSYKVRMQRKGLVQQEVEELSYICA